MIESKILLDSISSNGNRLVTLEVKFHRYILPEFNTHRVFSRNFRSSRAVPTKKLLEEVRTNPAIPVHFGKNQPGMQADEEHNVLMGLNGKILDSRDAWIEAANMAADVAEKFAEAGYHKQIVNRIIEPFMWVHGVVSSTEFENFFNLRCHKDAQPEFRDLARMMLEKMGESNPVLLRPGEWHLPYVSNLPMSQDREGAIRYIKETGIENTTEEDIISILQMQSVARCARVSYVLFDSEKPSDIQSDLKLYQKLVGSVPIHASPTEHQATPDFMGGNSMNPALHGNFVGWKQYRHTNVET